MKTHVIDSQFEHEKYLADDKFMARCGLILPTARFFAKQPDWCKNCSPQMKQPREIKAKREPKNG